MYRHHWSHWHITDNLDAREVFSFDLFPSRLPFVTFRDGWEYWFTVCWEMLRNEPWLQGVCLIYSVCTHSVPMSLSPPLLSLLDTHAHTPMCPLLFNTDLWPDLTVNYSSFKMRRSCKTVCSNQYRLIVQPTTYYKDFLLKGLPAR